VADLEQRDDPTRYRPTERNILFPVHKKPTEVQDDLQVVGAPPQTHAWGAYTAPPHGGKGACACLIPREIENHGENGKKKLRQRFVTIAKVTAKSRHQRSSQNVRLKP